MFSTSLVWCGWFSPGGGAALRWCRPRPGSHACPPGVRWGPPPAHPERRAPVGRCYDPRPLGELLPALTASAAGCPAAETAAAVGEVVVGEAAVGCSCRHLLGLHE